MLPNASLTRESIRNFLETPGPCVTIVAGDQPGESQTELKHALQNIRAQCESRGIDPEELLRPIPDAVRELQDGSQPAERVAIFRAPSVMLTLRAPGTLNPTAVVAERFDARALLAIANSAKHFYI